MEEKLKKQTFQTQTTIIGGEGGGGQDHFLWCVIGHF